jgi:predicted NUDIX family phosphoesterase
MKSEFILATTVLNEKDAPAGRARSEVIPMDYADFIKEVEPRLIIGMREMLETNEAFRQIIPYIIVIEEPELGVEKFVCYRRTKKVGEQRLAGNVSIGFGGHIELPDIINVGENLSTINLAATIKYAVTRELKEELQASSIGMDHEIDSRVLNLAIRTMLEPADIILIDDLDEVGRVHMGLVFELRLPLGIKVTTGEDELAHMESKTVDELLESSYPLETWTKLYLDYRKHGLAV